MRQPPRTKSTSICISPPRWAQIRNRSRRNCSSTPEEIEAAKKKFGLENIAQPIFGLNPGAEYGPAKRWPSEKFIAAAKEIQQRTNCVWLFSAAKSDLPIITAQIQSAIGNRQSAINLAGQTSLRELMALLKLCRVLLTNDTGPMHVAAALGTPVVVPFGSTSPELTGPGLPGDSQPSSAEIRRAVLALFSSRMSD